MYNNYVPATCFDLYKVIIKEVYEKGIQVDATANSAKDVCVCVCVRAAKVKHIYLKSVKYV